MVYIFGSVYVLVIGFSFHKWIFKNDWIFNFHFKIEKPKLKYKAFFFIMVVMKVTSVD